MPAESSIPCSQETRKLVKSSKRYEGQSYDELLRETFGDGDGTSQSEGS